MGLTAMLSRHSTTVVTTARRDVACTGLTYKIITGNVPKAMWDNSDLTITNAGGEDAQIPNTLKGLKIYAEILPSDNTRTVPLQQLMIAAAKHPFDEETGVEHQHPSSQDQLRPDGGDPLVEKINAVVKQNSILDVMTQTICDDDIAKQRGMTLQTLKKNGFKVEPTVQIAHLNHSDKHDLLAHPTLSSWY